MDLAEFVNRHAGETAWLFGKGPSLSTFDFTTAGPIRAAINDVAGHVPDCRYCFANDGVERWRDVYGPGMLLFQPSRALEEFDSTAPDAVDCEVVTYHDQHNDPRMLLPREELAQSLSIRRGTLGSAIQILHIMGIRAVHMVGFDGGNAHAPGIQWRTRLRNDHWKDYDAIKFAAIDAAELMGITLHFHNQDHTMTDDGKIFVRFLKNCMAEARPYSQGEIVKINPRVARELFACKAAEPFTPPGKIKVETATAPMDARESAVIETKKAPPKKRASKRK